MANLNHDPKFGPVTLFGSGETLPASGKAYEYTARALGGNPRIAILETPAGFQPNSNIVAQKVAEFIGTRLQNFDPIIHLIPARRNEGEFSTNDASILSPMLSANWVFLGPGSPTYAVRHLQNSLLLDYLYALHWAGGAITLSSAGVLAFSALTLPVYEIYKVGDDLHWVQGLNFFANFGLELVFIPHWNNNSGGQELDTNRCFMGVNRFHVLQDRLPKGMPVIGIDEQTALTITLDEDPKWIVAGAGGVTIYNAGKEMILPEGSYDPTDLGFSFRNPEFLPLSSKNILDEIERSRVSEEQIAPQDIRRLAQERHLARQSKDWSRADLLRDRISAQGWNILDTDDGFDLEPK